jgi:imidazolonepropionase-like amidohydrolase
VALGAVLGAAGVSAAQSMASPAAPPALVAVRDARIIISAGRVIERGTIVLRDGLVSAVGERADIPSGAWVIDGSGLTVYPGLVDALSTIGLPAALRLPEPQAGRGGGASGAQAAAPHSWGPDDRPATFTWMNAADDLNASDDRIERWRSGGFTSAVVSSDRGFFPGQAAYVNLAGDRASRMVVRTPVGTRVGLQGGPQHRGYPASLLGVLAYWRQTFLDVARYDEAWTIYQSAPAGLERPEYDRALEPLRQARASGQPVLFPGNLAKEITRSLAMAREAGVTPVIYGAQEAYRVADTLKGVAVLVNVDWPARDRNADPEGDVALSALRFWDRAPTSPIELDKAGVRFAFYGGRVADPAAFLANVRRSVQLGLSKDAALHALTTAPAEIFGVADRVGTLEAGKIANLLVTDGDLFETQTRIRHVFVDGRKFDPPPPSDAGQGTRAAARPADAPTAPVPMTVDRGPLTTASTVLVRNATVLTVTNGTIENGSILIRDGRIVEMGRNLAAPAGALVIDASGKYVIPGIIDAHSHIAADAINEGAVSVSAMVGIRDVIDPDAVGIYRALAGGVTAAHVLHGSANTIGGKNQLIKTRWGADAAGLIFEGATPTIKFALGENVKRDREPDRYPATRLGVTDVVRQAFLDAQEYQKRWREYRAGQARIPPKRDLKLETLVEILDGTRVIHAHSYRSDEILQLMRVLEEFGVRVNTFQHVLEGYKVADEIAKHGAMASTFSDWWAYKVEAYDAIPYNAALMTERGVIVSINSDDAEEMRHLNQEAAKTMRWGGLSENEALKLITLNPARQVGVDHRVGSIEAGKDADLVIYSGHPLSVYAVVEQVLIDGRVYFDRQKDAERRSGLDAEKKTLLERYRGGGRADRPEGTSTSAAPVEDVR